MELMSSLLLFALTISPQTLAESNDTLSYDVGLNNSTPRLELTRNVSFNISSYLDRFTSQTVFTDDACKNCTSCMERAILEEPCHVVEIKTRYRDIENELKREKRKVDDSKLTVKKSKSKKNKLITVFKYVGNSNKVYALKIKESSTHYDTNVTRLETKCEVYKVQQYYPCETHEANLILMGSKTSRKSRKEQSDDEPKEQATTDSPKVLMFKKREIDDLQIPEHFMSSVEENLY